MASCAAARVPYSARAKTATGKPCSRAQPTPYASGRFEQTATIRAPRAPVVIAWWIAARFVPRPEIKTAIGKASGMGVSGRAVATGGLRAHSHRHSLPPPGLLLDG